ncbi:MAG: hypothetical protein ACRDMU_02845 [Gaiellaceae bacterium]
MSALRIALTAYLVLIVAACGGSQPAADHRDDRYPVVTDPPPAYGETVTEGGALVSRPVKPTEYETEPSASCERQPYKSQSGNGLIIVPPRPGLAAEALSERSVKVSWWFEEVPTDCRPASLLVSIVANDASGATPTTVTVPFEGQIGEATLAYPEFLPPPDVALVSALMPRGERSRTARVLIRR